MGDADGLFRRERWAEARSAYDAVANGLDRHSRRFREATRGAVQASLKLGDWSGALDRASVLILKYQADRDRDSRGWKSDWDADEQWQATLSDLEFVRELLDQIATASRDGKGGFPSRLSATRIALDQELVRHLDPGSEGLQLGWDHALGEVDWWWKGVPEAQEYIDSDERYSRWQWPVGIPLGGDGQPVFLEPPQAYEPGLPRAKKLLFALAEIERLDNSKRRNAAATALLTRARLMRGLYGPQTDVDWWSAALYYQFDKRPWFVRTSSSAGVKATWELGDDEARTNIGERSRVIVLPESQSPLALLARLERDYPQSDSVAHALHERGLYYQSRRQFAKALDAYRREIQRFPNHPLAEKAKAQIASIEHADVILGRTGIYSSGLSPKLWFACRNAAAVEFTAHRFDFEGWSTETGGQWLFAIRYQLPPMFDHFLGGGGKNNERPKQLNKFVGPEVTRWTQQVPKSDRVASHATAAPLKEAGVYLVEARVPGREQTTRGLVVVTGIAIVQKPLRDRVLLWVVDPRSGKPLANQKVRVVESAVSDRGPKRETTLISDQRGVAEYRQGGERNRNHDGIVLASAEGRGITFCEFAGQAYDDRGQRNRQVLSLTDRPLYRPGSTVNFRIWVRDMLDRAYVPAEAGLKLQIDVRAPDYGLIRTLTLEMDESGSVSGLFTLGSETPLGEYRLDVHVPGDRFGHEAGEFRVEEYKTPEFQVTVSPAKSIARPGEPISARVEARYYFGAPVAGGEVRYRIFREEEIQAYSMPAEYDWLYGVGYGGHRSGRRHDEEDDLDDGAGWRYREWGYWPSPERIDEGRTRLDADGKAEIRFDTAARKPPRECDWRYTIEV